MHDQRLRAASARLHEEFSGTFAPETIDEVLQASFDDIKSRTKVANFVTLLSERFTRERLQALAQIQGAIVKEVPEVLFVCVHNAGRSQMAAALLNDHAQGLVHVRSAGSTPADEVNPAVRDAMAEVGLNLSQEFPKPLTDEVVRAADVVITMGCGDACPLYPGKRYLDWQLDDPAGKSIDEVRPIRDEINRRVLALLDELVGQPSN